MGVAGFVIAHCCYFEDKDSCVGHDHEGNPLSTGSFVYFTAACAVAGLSVCSATFQDPSSSSLLMLRCLGLAVNLAAVLLSLWMLVALQGHRQAVQIKSAKGKEERRDRERAGVWI